MIKIRKFELNEELDMSQPSVKELEDKFDFYNEKCFDGKLVRDFPIKYTLSKKTYGITYISLTRGPEGRRYGVRQIDLTPGRPRDAIFATLLHEMIHAYIAQVLNLHFSPAAAHGQVFQRLFKDIQAKGFRPSFSDSVESFDTESQTSAKFILEVRNSFISSKPILFVWSSDNLSSEEVKKDLFGWLGHNATSLYRAYKNTVLQIRFCISSSPHLKVFDSTLSSKGYLVTTLKNNLLADRLFDDNVLADKVSFKFTKVGDNESWEQHMVKIKSSFDIFTKDLLGKIEQLLKKGRD